jgi:hypothetical protein
MHLGNGFADNDEFWVMLRIHCEYVDMVTDFDHRSHLHYCWGTSTHTDLCQGTRHGRSTRRAGFPTSYSEWTHCTQKHRRVCQQIWWVWIERGLVSVVDICDDDVAQQGHKKKAQRHCTSHTTDSDSITLETNSTAAAQTTAGRWLYKLRHVRAA